MAGSVFEEKCNYKTLENDGSNDHKLICEPCLFDGAQEEAQGFCKACGEYLCPRCIKEHKKAKMTRRHLIVTDTLPDQPEVVKTMKKMVCCSEHPDMAITAKCLVHGVYICSTCSSKAHRGCNIANVSEWKDDGHKPKEILDGLTELFAAACSAKASIEKNNKTIDFEGSRIKKDISTYIQKIMDSVKTLENKSIEEVETALASGLSELEKDKCECEEIQNIERYDKTLLEAAVAYGDENDVSVLADILGNKLKSLKERIKSLNEKSRLILQFTANSDCVLTNLPLVGKVEVHREEQQSPLCEGNIDVSSDALEEEEISVTTETFSSVDCTSGNLKQQSGYHDCDEAVHKVREIDDIDPCNIYKIILLDGDGYLALLDHNNSKLKVLNVDFCLETSLRFDDNPVDTCRIEKNTVAVTFNLEKRVQKYKIENGIVKYVGGFPTSLHCLGIAAYRNDMVAVLMSDEPFLVKRSNTTDIHEIQIRKVRNGQIIKTYSDFCAIDELIPSLLLRNVRRLVFTDPKGLVLMEEQRVMAFTLNPSECEAEEKWFYASSSDRLVRDMRDILYDGQHLYVCADQGGVLQMSAKNGKNRKVIHNIASPRSVAIDKSKNVMIVGCREDDFIYVYKYS